MIIEITLYQKKPGNLVLIDITTRNRPNNSL
jgi:hypothetical protein